MTESVMYGRRLLIAENDKAPSIHMKGAFVDHCISLEVESEDR